MENTTLDNTTVHVLEEQEVITTLPTGDAMTPESNVVEQIPLQEDHDNLLVTQVPTAEQQTCIQEGSSTEHECDPVIHSRDVMMVPAPISAEQQVRNLLPRNQPREYTVVLHLRRNIHHTTL